MSRINTNVSSLIARTNLGRSNADLQVALNRLSTGLRINVGKDDPAGLIASENLRSDITAINKAITNTERANQVIGTADSALGQVNSLLNDIRGLVTEAANSGALSDEQIAANQLQVDSSLEAINRIAQTTTFQGRRLLDGSLDFVSTANSIASISDLSINQANLGALGSITANVDITAAATQAEITNVNATGSGATATLGLTNGDIVVTAASASTDFNGVAISFVADDSVAAGAASASYDADAKTLKIKVNSASTATIATIRTEIDGLSEFNAKNLASADGLAFIPALDLSATADTLTTANQAAATLAFAGTNNDVIIRAASAGTDFNDVTVAVTSTAGTGTATAGYDAATKTLSVNLATDGTSTGTLVAAAINSLAEFSAAVDTTGDTYTTGGGLIAAVTDSNFASTGKTGGLQLLDDLVLQVSGRLGSEVITFNKDTVVGDIVQAINLVSDATGVEATNDSGNLILSSTEYGTDALIDIDVISEGSSGTFEANLSATRTTGTDIAAAINGIVAQGKGNTISIKSNVLDLSLTVTDGSTTDFSFDITDGGALFQLGPDVVSNQQARIGIGSVNTGSLRGTSGRLYEIGSGHGKALATDPGGAAKIVDEVITKVTELRGRLGAFQRTTLDTNIASLNDTLSQLTEAESSIRDADFAAESAALTRAQILVQSGTAVLQIANQNPQNVLALLR